MRETVIVADVTAVNPAAQTVCWCAALEAGSSICQSGIRSSSGGLAVGDQVGDLTSRGCRSFPPRRPPDTAARRWRPRSPRRGVRWMPARPRPQHQPGRQLLGLRASKSAGPSLRRASSTPPTSSSRAGASRGQRAAITWAEAERQFQRQRPRQPPDDAGGLHAAKYHCTDLGRHQPWRSGNFGPHSRRQGFESDTSLLRDQPRATTPGHRSAATAGAGRCVAGFELTASTSVEFQRRREVPLDRQ